MDPSTNLDCYPADSRCHVTDPGFPLNTLYFPKIHDLAAMNLKKIQDNNRKKCWYELILEIYCPVELT